jgi:hypothetical protein
MINLGLLGTLMALSIIAADGAHAVTSMEHPGLTKGTLIHHAPAIIKERHGNKVASTNWSGYALTGAKGSVTDVKGSWRVPTVDCGAIRSAYASFWVGIDGYSSNTVEQIGTDSDCQSGSPVYYAWFEFYPHLSFTINTITVQPGDIISAEVKAGSQGQFTVLIQDGAQAFSTTTKMKSADQSSAEWVIEAPYSGGVLPLADFSSISFGDDYTPVQGTCFATVAGVAQTIGPFSKGNVDEITMETSSGAIKSQPSDLSTDGSSFTDAWISAGP